MEVQNVVVAGGGVLGSQIAFQSAYYGFNVTLYDINEVALEKAKERLSNLRTRYVEDLNAMEDSVDKVFEFIRLSHDIAESVKDADIVIEAIPEVLNIKKEFYETLGNEAPEKTIFATNSSTLTPSEFKEATGRKEKFLALHFANEIWLRNTGEVMRTEDTDEKVFQEVLDFAGAIGMVPLPIYKEHPAYILNSLLVPYLNASSYLLGSGIADVKTIDKTWMKATNDEHGPFGMGDIVGINTRLNILKARETENMDDWYKNFLDILQKMADEGKSGKTVGEGFYKYPNPMFNDSDFFNNPQEIKELKHEFKKITVAGGGVLGSQIAFQTASGGFDVSLYDINDEALKAAKERVNNIKIKYQSDMDVSEDKVEEIAGRISCYSNLEKATENADLVIEVVPEDIKIKRSFYKELSKVLNKEAYIITNSSSLKPSDFEEDTGRPEKFAALHFANNVWIKNTGEVMVAGQTTDETFNKILAFARDIHLTVLPIKREQPGYILNTLLLPLLTAAQRLLAQGVAEVETIDKTWMIGFHAEKGPFGIIDSIGLNTMLNITKATYEKTEDEIDGKCVELLQEKIGKNELGRGTGKGFYDYSKGIPFFQEDFLK